MWRLIDRWITERGSAQVLRERLALAQEQATALRAENTALKQEVADLKVRLEQKETQVKNLADALEDCRRRSNIRMDLI